MNARLWVVTLLLVGCKSRPPAQWAQRSIPGLGLSLTLPAEPRPAQLDQRGARAVIYTASTDRAEFAACGITFDPLPAGKLDEDATMGAMMNLMGKYLQGAERHPFLLGGHLGAELVGSVGNQEARSGFALEKGGPIVLRMLALAEQNRGLIWYGVSARNEDVTAVVESAQLE